MIQKILIWTIVGFLVIQLIPVDRVNPPVAKSENFVTVLNTPPKIATMLKNACYDCHSNETVYPKYAYVAPISWSVKHHINEGRDYLNFSKWATFNQDIKKGMLERSVEQIENRMMPLPGYIPYHDKANLTTADRKILANYFKGLLESGRY